MNPPTDTNGARVFAPAKINLCLHVGARRADGYHELESLVVFADIGDELMVRHDESISLFAVGPCSAGLSVGEDNLVMRAARLLCEASNNTFGARLTLNKRIPIASGLGGGSADAAAALRGLAKLWGLTLSRDELTAIAARLGSDVPMCIANKTAWVEGRGERISQMPTLPRLSLLLVNPRVQVSTAAAFSRLKSRQGTGFPAPIERFSGARELVNFLHATSNDLEAPAIEIAPVIKVVLEELSELPEVRLARMSGSGATCFGLMDDEEAAQENAHTLRKAHTDWWVEVASVAKPESSEPRPV